MMCRVNIAIKVHNVMVQTIGKNNLIAGNFRVCCTGPNMVDLAGFFVSNLVGVLFHGLLSGLLARALLHWLGIDCNKVCYS